MIAVDTNILARFYCDDPDDVEAKRQRPRARRVMLESVAVFVPLTVILEFEWVMRGFYEVEPNIFCQAIEHLLGMPHVTVERWEAVKDAVDLHRKGLDFADALHWVCSAACSQFVSFDDRGFVRRAKRLKLVPDVTVPGP
ncbi:type II toxin-antitoxin system VapC family toxin [Sulfuritalea sp.]|uniref:type II toxin-antitoxin system VapC family toxin n=1 Tax=Sulfuritalea sp. TaxID=2480090 RepID=UPI00286E1218|nr:type II toxin-antitoxin system VapC family toxin [Sulfuritalea sp.]